MLDDAAFTVPRSGRFVYFVNTRPFEEGPPTVAYRETLVCDFTSANYQRRLLEPPKKIKNIPIRIRKNDAHSTTQCTYILLSFKIFVGEKIYFISIKKCPSNTIILYNKYPYLFGFEV